MNDLNDEHILFSITTLHFKFKRIFILYFQILALLIVFLWVLFSLASIYKVKVDTNLYKITFFSLFIKQTIRVEDISEYKETYKRAKLRNWKGLLIKTNDGKIIQVTDQNIISLSDFKNYLDEKKIYCAGQTKMIFPFN
jgi:hypothetical protein